MCVCARACVCVCAFVFVRVPERAGALMCGLIFFLSKWQPDLIKGNYCLITRATFSMLPSGFAQGHNKDVLYCIIVLCSIVMITLHRYHTCFAGLQVVDSANQLLHNSTQRIRIVRPSFWTT